MEKRRTHYFPADDSRVITGLLPNGEYGAYLVDYEDEPRIRGFGHSREAAIADLNEAIGVDEPEEIDRQAQRWDHARDLRKHSS